MALFFDVPVDFFYDEAIEAEYRAACERVQREWEETVSRVRARLNLNEPADA